jgi:DNA replication protein DnaC
MPSPLSCLGGCGIKIEPIWVDEIINPVDPLRRPLAGTRCWCYPFEVCADCKERQAREAAERENARNAKEREAELSGILGGPKSIGFTLDVFRSGPGSLEALQEARAFHPKRSNLYIWGPCGTGKTHLASAIGSKWFNEGARVEFWKPPALMRHMRVKDADEQEKRIERASSVPVFILDDLGVGMATEFYNQILWEIIDNRDIRLRNGLVITSNLSLAALSEKLQDDRLASRIAGMCKVIKIEGKDWRVGA